MKKLLLRTMIAMMLVSLTFLGWPSSVHADDMTCTAPTPVRIDIKPGNAQNRVKLSARGQLAVAVLTTAEFDASQFTPEMAHLNDANTPMADACMGSGALHWSLDDENGDGRPDLVFFFGIRDLNFSLNTTSATFMAHGAYAGSPMHIAGSDAVQVVP